MSDVNNASEPACNSVHLRWGVKIPMRDGIDLNATLYISKSLPSPAPVIFTLTPYISDHCHERAKYYASRGLSFAVVDARGRGNSQGIFRPMIQEAKDGYDVVEWLARQPYCNGKVAMWGGSYLGYCQWATAKEFPPHLATIVPMAAPYVGVDFPIRRNIFRPSLMRWITVTSGVASQMQIYSDTAFWSEIYREWYESGLSFRDLDGIVGNASSIFQEWVSHPEPDSFWDAHNPTATEYAQLEIPILTITGSYDDDQPGALEHYKEHMRNASAAARELHYLIIGPWDHRGSTGTPCAEFGGIKLGAASLLDFPKLHREWYAWTMQSGPKPEFLEKPIAYYVMGSERWRYTDTLAEVTSVCQTLFLDSTNNANDVFSSGSLGEIVGMGPPDTYTYNPCDTLAPEIEAEAQADGCSLVDQTVTMALRGKQLVYHSAPFRQDCEVSGFFTLRAWISIDTPDTDLFVSVHEISQDGNSIRLTTDAIRTRYREGARTPKLIQTREPLCYDFNRFTFVSRLIRRGHRLRLIIAPIGRLVESNFVQKNYNGGGVVAEESSMVAKAVTVTLFHDRDFPSALSVPLGCSDT